MRLNLIAAAVQSHGPSHAAHPVMCMVYAASYTGLCVEKRKVEFGRQI